MPHPTLEQLDPHMAVAAPDSDLLWYDLLDLGLTGQGWTDTAHPYDRLPARAEGRVTEAVWALSHHSAGLAADFVSDAPEIAARWTLRGERLAMDHMPATGMSGLDLYTRWEGRWRWLGVGRPTHLPDNEAQLVAGIPPDERQYRLYLPLYNGVEEVKIGIPAGARLCRVHSAGAACVEAAAPPRLPVVCYGTSITQGGCASRPGMAYPALLGRHLERPVLNLGFSGSGRMEPIMAELLAELDAAAYLLDCLPNLAPEEAAERVEPFVAYLRAAHPATPIVLVESVVYQNGYLLEASRERYERSNAILRELYRRRSPADLALHYVEGAGLMGEDGEGTVECVHATDLGFLRMAQTLAPVLRQALA